MFASPVEVLWTARYDYPPKWRLETHGHDYFQMLCFLTGRGSFTLNGTSRPITGGLTVLVKPGEEHGLNASSLIKTLDIKFLITSGRLRAQVLRCDSYTESGTPDIVALLNRVRFEGEQRAPLYREMCAAHLIQILILVLRHGAPALSPDSALTGNQPRTVTDPVTQSVLAMIHSRYAKGLTVEAIAAELGYSERHIRGRFHEMTGVSPSDYLMHYRLDKARELLEFSDFAIKEVADMVGFKSVHHFTRVFARLMHAPPAHWRKTYREGVRKDVNIRPDFFNVIWTTPASLRNR